MTVTVTVTASATEQATLVREVEELLTAVRADLDDCSRTARAIDRNDLWGVIADAAAADRQPVALVNYLRAAEARWLALQ